MLLMMWGPLLLAAYYLALVMLNASQEKPAGTVMTRYAPPDQISPAAARFVTTRGVDGKTVAAVLAQLAFKRLIVLTRQGSGFQVQRTGPSTLPALPPEEFVLLRLLFAFGDPNVISPMENARMNGMVDGIMGALQEQFKGVFWDARSGLAAIGVLVSLACVMAMAPGGAGVWKQLIMSLWGVSIGTLMFLVVWIRGVPTMRDLVTGRLRGAGLIPAVLTLTIPIVMVAAVVFALERDVSLEFAIMTMVLAAINGIGGPELRVLTPRGRRTLDELAGYRQFLVSVEQDRLNRLNAPDQPSGLDEHMAYAIALDVKEAWGDHICETFAGAEVSKE